MLPRPCIQLSNVKKKYPEIWKLYDQFLADKGKDLPDWPLWCYCPVAAAYAVVSSAGPMTIEKQLDVGMVASLAAWRVSQGIYRFDKDTASAIMDTDLDKNLPSDVLYRMPEWGMYIETPEPITTIDDHTIVGFFAHLECDANTNKTELRLLLDAIAPEERLISIPLHISDSGTLSDAIIGMYTESINNLGMNISSLKSALNEKAANDSQKLQSIVSLILYLCSKNAEVKNGTSNKLFEEIKKPSPVKTKKGLRYFAPDKPEVWEVGFRIGDQIRSGRRYEESGTHAGPRPHMRRAHWHTFWEGARSRPEERYTNVKWLPPIPVNVGDVGVTIRNVK